MSRPPASAPPGGAPAIEMRDVVKRFGEVTANHRASLEVPAGEIHALVGENGAGKSTLMRVLSGLYPPDAGTVRVAGRDVTGWTTGDAIEAGVGMVHQHFMLVPTLTVAENVVLGREPRRGLRFDRAAAERAVVELGERTGLRVPADRRVSELSVGEAQRVEILKTLYRGARILILDEPTAVLSPIEVDELWRVLRRLRDEGGTVVLITHKLDEVVAVSDAITVMRAGATVARLRTADATPASIARAMVGRDVRLALDEMGRAREGTGPGWTDGAGAGTASHARAGGSPPDSNVAPDVASSTTVSPPTGSNARTAAGSNPRTPAGSDARPGAASGARSAAAATPALTLRDLVVLGPGGRPAVDGVSLTIAPGEILGIAGVEGNGQTALVEAIAGLAEVARGSIHLGDRDVTALAVRTRADAGLSHIPEDRHVRGLVLEFPVADNLVLGRQHRFSRGPALDRARVAENARAQIAAFDIRPPAPALPARALSGGNQQKIVVAREMGRDFSVLLAAQPTRGVDVGAIEFIHDQLRAAAAAGKAVLLVSADLAEVLALSDRVAVMYGGRIVAVLPRHQATPDVLGPYMTGATPEAAP